MAHAIIFVDRGPRTKDHDFTTQYYTYSAGAYVEVKGYETDRDRAKWNQFPERLIIIKEQQIKEIRKGCFKGID